MGVPASSSKSGYRAYDRKLREQSRNTLKQIAKIPYNLQLNNKFETCYLLLAKSYILREKFDLAQDLCKRCIVLNKSYSQAWETIGDIMEKEQDYVSACECYEKCWNLKQKWNASIGYKLASSYMKLDRQVDAICVCEKVLIEYPEFTKMKDDILDQCILTLRP